MMFCVSELGILIELRGISGFRFSMAAIVAIELGLERHFIWKGV